MHDFPTDYASILTRLEAINPQAYSHSRNYLTGSTTKLSPYITHGVLTTQDVGRIALTKATRKEAEILLKELAWRDFYYASWNQLGDTMFRDLWHPQPLGQFVDLPTAVTTATTGITAIDQSIEELLQTGYLHNHSRLWLAMLCCNVARTAWWNPSRWMYYHLLDGDLASNTMSWQWVAGSYRKQPYIADQENINTYSGITQRGTYLDVPYEELTLRVPQNLQERSPVHLSTALVKTSIPTLSGEVLLYHAWALSPTWHSENSAPRVFLLEPEHFAQFPISKKRITFMLRLSKNIPGLTVVVANFKELQTANPNAIFRYIHHPTNTHWQGERENREPLFVVRNPVTASWSFSKFWAHSSITLHMDKND